MARIFGAPAEYYDLDEQEVVSEGESEVYYDESVGFDDDNRFSPALAQQAFTRDHTVRWGDTRTLRTIATSGFVTGEFLRVDLPQPRVCSLSIHAEHAEDSTNPIVFSTTVDIIIGVGASQIIKHVGFGMLPAPTSPIDVVIPDLPINSIHIRASILANPGASVRLTAQLTPVFPVK